MGNRIAVGLRDEGSPEYDWQMLGDSSRVCSSPEIGTGEYYAQNSDFPISNTQIAGMPSGPRDPISLRIPPIAFGYRNPRVDEDDEKNEKYDVFHPHGGSRTTEERTARYMTVSGSFSAPTSARNSPEPRTPVQDISMLTLANQSPVTDIVIRTGEDAVRPGVAATKEAHQLVRQHTRRGARSGYIPFAASKPIAMPHCGFATPTNHAGEDYVQRPEQYRGGVLSSLLSLYNAPQATEPARLGHNHSSSLTSISTSGRTTPKWYNKSANSSSTSLGGVIAASGSTLVSPATAGMNMGSTTNGFGQVKRPKIKHRPHSTGFVDKIKNISKPGLKLEEEIRVREIRPA